MNEGAPIRIIIIEAQSEAAIGQVLREVITRDHSNRVYIERESMSDSYRTPAQDGSGSTPFSPEPATRAAGGALGVPQRELLRVLYLTASSRGDLRVDEEIRRVKAGVRAALHRDLVLIEHMPAATVSDFLDGLTRHKPHIVHFSGHATQNLLVFDTGDPAHGPGHQVPARAFARAISAVDTPPSLVVLNACKSEAQLAELLTAVPLAVGMSDSIADTDAIVFATRFYTSLADGQSVRGAYQTGKVQLELSGLSGADLPILAHDPTVDPVETILVLPAPRPPASNSGQA